jgi:hypothetical protein
MNTLYYIIDFIFALNFFDFTQREIIFRHPEIIRTLLKVHLYHPKIHL